LISESSNNPAKVIKDFLKKNDTDSPVLKGAFIENETYLGHDQIDILATLKSKEELIGEVITLLQSPMKNLLSSIKSPSANISGILKSLSERKEENVENKDKKLDTSIEDNSNENSSNEES